jgi:hypothetical protein
MYYRLGFAQKFAGSFLSHFYIDGNEIDERRFLTPAKVDVGLRLTVGCASECRLHDVNFAASDLIVCKRRAAEILSAVCGESIQLVPVAIRGIPTNDGDLFLIQILEVVDCIDTELSEYTRWTKSDHRSDLAGKFRMMMKLTIDGVRASGHLLFRPAGWEIAIIAHEKVVTAIHMNKLSGVRAEPVSLD